MVYVLNNDGSPLMPCTEAKARHLVEGGKANQAARKVAGFGLGDKVMCSGQLCYIHGRRSSGYFDIRRLDGTRVHAGIHYSHLTLVERANTNLIYKEVMEVPPSGRA